MAGPSGRTPGWGSRPQAFPAGARGACRDSAFGLQKGGAGRERGQYSVGIWGVPGLHLGP